VVTDPHSGKQRGVMTDPQLREAAGRGDGSALREAAGRGDGSALREAAGCGAGPGLAWHPASIATVTPASMSEVGRRRPPWRDRPRTFPAVMKSCLPKHRHRPCWSHPATLGPTEVWASPGSSMGTNRLSPSPSGADSRKLLASKMGMSDIPFLRWSPPCCDRGAARYHLGVAPGRRSSRVPSGQGPVVKLHEVPTSGFPAVSRMPVESTVVYFVRAARVTDGFRVATRVVGL
jgi:hypothetical protein